MKNLFHFKNTLFYYETHPMSELQNLTAGGYISTNASYNHQLLVTRLEDDCIPVEKCERVYLNVYGGNSKTDFAITGEKIPTVHYVFPKTAFVDARVKDSVFKDVVIQPSGQDLTGVNFNIPDGCDFKVALKEMYASLFSIERFAILKFEGFYKCSVTLTNYLKDVYGFSIINMSCKGVNHVDDTISYGEVEVIVSLLKVSPAASRLLSALGFSVPRCIGVFPFRDFNVFANLDTIDANTTKSSGIISRFKNFIKQGGNDDNLFCGLFSVCGEHFAVTMRQVGGKGVAYDDLIFGSDLYLCLVDKGLKSVRVRKYGSSSRAIYGGGGGELTSKRNLYIGNYKVTAIHMCSAALLSNWMKQADYMLIHPDYNQLLSLGSNRENLSLLSKVVANEVLNALLVKETESPIEAARLALELNENVNLK